MKHEGMVHALEEIRRLLRPGGILIDIHPVTEPWLCDVNQDGRVLFSEPSPTYTYEEDLRQADLALARVIERRLFVLERQEIVDFFTYAGSAGELRDFYNSISAYEESAPDEEVMRRVEELRARMEQVRQAAGRGAEAVAHERARITRLDQVR